MKIHKNVLSPETLSRCIYDLGYFRDKAVWKNSGLFWHEDVRVGTTGIVTQTLVSVDISKLLDAELDKYFYEYKKDLKMIEYQFFVWNALSGISTHNDSMYRFGATLYLNPVWKMDWGGTFLWKDKNEEDYCKWNALCPEQNMLVINDEKEFHLVSSISPHAAEERYSIQIWGVPEDISPGSGVTLREIKASNN